MILGGAMHNKEYFESLQLGGIHTINVNHENGDVEKVVVHEDNLEGFIQCLKFFGYEENKTRWV